MTGTPANADSDPVDPQNPATPTTVTADRLPTAQINGVVWSQDIAGNRVYAGGSFDKARPAGANSGQNEVTRNNLLAYNLQTGQLDPTFAPNFNQQVTAVAVSPDGSQVYVGGEFTQLNGQQQRRFAAFNANTGQLLSQFNLPFYGSVDAIVATNDTVYVGGSFLGIGSADRWNLAALDADTGQVLDWAPKAEGGTVSALAIEPDGSKIVVGGSFTTLNGSSDPGYGLGMVDATTGQNLPFETNDIVRNATDDGAITTLSADEDYVYGGGYTFGKSGGTLEGVFAADWDGGDLHWINDCHGDSYSVHPQGDVIYQAGHFHYCENIDGFHQGDGGVGDYPYNRATAMSKAATGTATWEPDQGRYYSFEGEPTPSQLTWWPSLNAGSATGQSQGPWDVNGTDDYIVMGGEFTRVNGTNQQGLVRYALKETAPNNMGPDLSNNNFPIKATSKASGKVEVNWAANHDPDNENLTYRVYRDTQNAAGLVHTRDLATPYWKLPGMAFTDSVAPGSSHQYRVSATDSSGNVANSPWVSVTAASTGTMSAYERAVRNDEPTHYWRLGGANGTPVSDTVGFAPQTAGTGVTRDVPGAIAGDTNPAARFSGTNTGFSATGDTADPPDVFTLEAWFKTSTSAGGKIVGWGNRASRRAKADRHIYMDGSGRIHFGVKPDETRQVVTSGGGLNDGQWHQATATLSNAGMKLYVDGEQVAQNPSVTVGEHLSRGLWSIGGDTLASWPSRPTSDYFNGDIDEVAVYRKALSASRIAAHYAAGSNGQPQNAAPVAAFTSTKNNLQVSVDAGGSSDSDGTIQSYAWDFGDGASGTGKTASHTYTGPGTYQVKLTVTDNDGATGTVTHAVTVTAPPQNADPMAAFTSTTDGLDASFDGSGSTDSDGTIASYAWEFGDGETATGAMPSHTYASADTYQVKLTVTDNDGATNSVTKPVTVADDGPGPEPEQIAADTFQRSVTNAWGTADKGGSWARTGSAGSYQVDGSVGRMTTNGSGNGKAAYLGALSADETDSTIDLVLNKEPAGGAAFLSYSGRRIDDDNKYSAMVRYLADGSVNLSLRKFVNGTETNLGHTKVDGLTPGAGDRLHLRLQVTGNSQTHLAAKLWSGNSEPQGWLLEADDGTAALQAAGGVGVDMYLGGALSNAPITAGFDNLEVKGPGDGPVPDENRPPNAKDVARSTLVNKTVQFRPDVTDPEGLTVDYVPDSMAPKHGTATWVSGNKIRYVPDRRFVGADTFKYAVTDTSNPEVTGKVTVNVRKAPAEISHIRITPDRVQPNDRARLQARVRAPRVRERGKFVIKDGKRVLAQGKLNTYGNISTRLKRMPAGAHQIRIMYQGSKIVQPKTNTIKVRVRKAKANMRNVRVQPQILRPQVHARVSGRVRARRTRARGKIVIRKGSRRVGKTRLDRHGAFSTRIRRLGRGLHRLRVRYLGSPKVRRTSETVKVRVRR